MNKHSVDLIKLGHNIKTAREHSRLTQSELAKFLGIDQSMVSKYESGERAMGSDTLERIAAFLCTPEKDLLYSDEIYPKHTAAFRAENLTFEDICILADVNKIILNQIEMDEMLYAEP